MELISSDSIVGLVISVLLGPLAAGWCIFLGSKADSRGVVVMMKNGERAGLLDCWRSRFRDYRGKYHVFLSADMINRLVSISFKITLNS